MRKSLVAGNWKMHGSTEYVVSHLGSLQAKLEGIDIDVAVMPPTIYLQQAAQLLQDQVSQSQVNAPLISLGAQNLAVEQEGAFTGEISAEMLADVGCQYVLVGHSERRSLYGETNQLVAQKFMAALRARVTPILCVGETLAEREAGKTLSIIGDQLQAVLDIAGIDTLAASVIAYEPIWAIGTGQTATPEEAQEIHAAIRSQLGSNGEQAKILYGGSVKASNARALFAQPDIDGGLVGGASLNVEEFAAICSKAE